MPKSLNLLFTAIFLLSGLFSASPIAATNHLDQIKTDIITTYQFDASGRSKVDQRITLTNLVSLVYTTSYSLSVRGLNLTDITASDHTGNLPITVTEISEDQTVISVDFSDPAAGKNSSHTFNLSYTGPAAVKTGQIWEITLPKFAIPENSDSYTQHLLIPKSFGLPAFISPPPTSTSDSISDFTTYSYLSPVAASGVVAAFGDFQIFDFSLDYHLSNTSLLSKTLSIAIPPDTSYQRLFYDSIEPRPKSVTQDPDGNWIASFTVSGRKSATVTVKGQAHILSQPTAATSSPSAELLNSYLSPTDAWPVDDPQIQKLSQTLASPKAIYDYVISTLSYDYSRLTTSTSRQGASWVLSNPTSAICTDFTDLFITLARASGIPAREIQGFAATDDPKLKPLSLLTDVLHSWPEYWDASAHTWRAIDPTWGKTTNGIDYFSKLDLDHFAFVIHGQDYSSPPPAGLYKLDPSSKDVQVTVGEYHDYFPAPLDPTWKPPFQFLPFIKNSSLLTISNPNGIAFHRVPLYLGSTGLYLEGLPPRELPVLPPFSSITVPIDFRSSRLPSFTSKYLTAQVGTQAITYNVSDYSFILWYAVIALTITGFIFALAFFALKAWHLHFQKPIR